MPLSTQSHLQQFVDALAKMAEIAEGSIDQDSRDRFAMLSVIADKHWKVVAKYLPSPAAQGDEVGIRTIKIQPVMTHEQMLDLLD